MAKIHYDNDASLDLVKAKKVAIVGYGSQGHAHALNLKDSGVEVRVGLPQSSKSRAKAEAAGLKVDTPKAVAAWADVIMVLAPDTSQARLYKEEIAPGLKAGKTLMFAHGFNIRYKTIEPHPEVDVSLVAPKSPGHRVRETFQVDLPLRAIFETPTVAGLAALVDEAILLELDEMSDEEAESALAGVGGAFEPATERVR